jgi:hypothetical protein
MATTLEEALSNLSQHFDVLTVEELVENAAALLQSGADLKDIHDAQILQLFLHIIVKKITTPEDMSKFYTALVFNTKLVPVDTFTAGLLAQNSPAADQFILGTLCADHTVAGRAVIDAVGLANARFLEAVVGYKLTGLSFLEDEMSQLVWAINDSVEREDAVREDGDTSEGVQAKLAYLLNEILKRGAGFRAPGWIVDKPDPPQPSVTTAADEKQ